MNFTKELKPHPSPEPRVDLAQALKRQAVFTDDRGETREAAGLIKSLHQSGGDDLLKKQPSGRDAKRLVKAEPAQPAQQDALEKLIDAQLAPLRKQAAGLQDDINRLGRTAAFNSDKEIPRGSH